MADENITIMGGHWGVVPEALVEDPRLGAWARNIATWLSIRPAGWVVRRGHMLHKLGIGEDAWLAARRQLVKAGYIEVFQSRVGGRFEPMCLEFNRQPAGPASPTPDADGADGSSPPPPLRRASKPKVPGVPRPRAAGSGAPSTAPGFSGHGKTGRGGAGNGATGHGEPRRLTTPVLTTPVLTTPPHPPVAVVVVDEIQKRGTGSQAEAAPAHLDEHEQLHWPPGLDAGQRQACSVHLAGVGQGGRRQQLLDELAGRIDMGRVKNPARYLRNLVQRDVAGGLVLELASNVAAARDARAAAAAARAARDATPNAPNSAQMEERRPEVHRLSEAGRVHLNALGALRADFIAGVATKGNVQQRGQP